MEKQYERDAAGTTLLIKDTGTEKYLRRMITENRIPGFLPVQEQIREEGTVYAYSISGLVSLKEYLKHHIFTGKILRQLIFTLCQSSETLEEYLLPFEGVRLEPDMIFLDDKETPHFFLCYCPEDFYADNQGLSDLLKYLMEQTDPAETDCAALCYQLYGKLQKENFCLSEFMDAVDESTDTEAPFRAKHRAARFSDTGTERETEPSLNTEGARRRSIRARIASFF